MGFFGNLFDFNNDGKLDALEKTADFMTFHKVMSDGDKESDNSTYLSSASTDDEEVGKLQSALDDAGIDEIDFEFMDDDEKREALEDVGLDHWDYDL